MEDDVRQCLNKVDNAISIHVPRVEDDGTAFTLSWWDTDFNPRPPCGGRRYVNNRGYQQKYFNPRPPCGGRLFVYSATRTERTISIHVPRVEDDLLRLSMPFRLIYFNPRPPCGGRL